MNSLTGSLTGTQLFDTDGDNFNDTILFSFSTITYIADANPNNHMLIGVVQAAILPEPSVVNGATIVTYSQYAYATINLTASVNLIVTEPMVKANVTSVEYVNTISYQVNLIRNCERSIFTHLLFR